MNWNPLTWFDSSKVADEVATVEDAAPAKTVTILHTMLEVVKEKEAGHPWIVKCVDWFDQLVEKHGESLLVAVEGAVLKFMAIKYPVLAPLLTAAKAAHGAISKEGQ